MIGSDLFLILDRFLKSFSTKKNKKKSNEAVFLPIRLKEENINVCKLFKFVL